MSFKGSINESWTGWHERGNHETLDVFCSWREGRDERQVKRNKHYFDKLWNGEITDLEVMDFPKAAIDKLTTVAKGSLDEIICAHARIAPYFCSQDEAINIFKQFLREIPKEGWGCSSRLRKRDFHRIDKNIIYAVEKAFAGNLNQKNPIASNKIFNQAAKRFKQIGFDPFNKSTWHLEIN